ncbi:CarD family transcriptional regulator [Massilibacterium senegalense]|uniref:CarD family transcriptional regulator n=1 Tax=Massilibacterium senegalense TaxID=1632858 RepID=UPI000784EC5B|nr:CarD family transcriptional regulator [Massilibacterium senegalense]
MEVDHLFEIGDKIVYPMHGAGVIESIEEKEILGKKMTYYVINIPISNMNVMIPMEKVEESGIRSVVDKNTLEHVLYTFHHEEPDESLPWKQRYNMNLKKISTGNIDECAEVVRDLIHSNKKRTLNASEKKMLDTAKKILISEFSLVKKIPENQVISLFKIQNIEA